LAAATSLAFFKAAALAATRAAILSASTFLAAILIAI